MCYNSVVTESADWKHCPFCNEENVIKRVRFGIDLDGEETMSTKKFGTEHYITRPHSIECPAIKGTFDERQTQFANYYRKKLVNKKFKSHAEI